MSIKTSISVEESKEMTCPVSMGGDIVRGCDGPACMAWRWVRTHVKNDNGNLVERTDEYGVCGMAAPTKAFND